MTAPLATVVRTAATPEQAKVFVALLAAEGIPAHVDGDSLADEVAISRRLMNLNGTRVMVPTASLERAREVLAAVAVDEAELEVQALAAEAPEVMAPRSPSPARRNHWPIVVTTAAAVTFLGLWLAEVDAKASARHPFVRYEPTATGMREVRIADGILLAEYVDLDRDGAYEVVHQFADQGQLAKATDQDRDGRFEQLVENRRSGLTCTWADTDRDGLLETCTVTDGGGKQLQVLRWVDGKGYEVQAR